MISVAASLGAKAMRGAKEPCFMSPPPTVPSPSQNSIAVQPVLCPPEMRCSIKRQDMSLSDWSLVEQICNPKSLYHCISSLILFQFWLAHRDMSLCLVASFCCSHWSARRDEQRSILRSIEVCNPSCPCILEERLSLVRTAAELFELSIGLIATVFNALPLL